LGLTLALFQSVLNMAAIHLKITAQENVVPQNIGTSSVRECAHFTVRICDFYVHDPHKKQQLYEVKSGE
jgi:hypothetical protein